MCRTLPFDDHYLFDRVAGDMSLTLSHIPRVWQTCRLGMRNSSSQAALRSILSKELSEIRAAGTYKVERVITTPQAAAIQVQEREGKLLNFCANNYLGLSVRNKECSLSVFHSWYKLAMSTRARPNSYDVTMSSSDPMPTPTCSVSLIFIFTCMNIHAHTMQYCSLTLRWWRQPRLLWTSMAMGSAQSDSSVEHR